MATNENRSNAPRKYPARAGLTLALLVGGFILTIMAIGWIYLASRG